MLTQSPKFRFSYLRRGLIVPVALLIFSSLAFVTDEKMDRLSENLTIPVPQPSEKVPANSGAITERDTRFTGPKDTTPKKREIFTFVEHPPTFPGGDNVLNNFLATNIRYPKAALEKKIAGTVFVSFIVADDGSVTDVKTVGTPKGGGLEEEAVRVVKMMSKWKPGVQNNRKVNVQFNLPINFTLAPPPPPKPGNRAPNANGVFTFVEQPPTFKGGDSELNKYLSQTIRYPKEATQKNIQGTIFVSFVVDEKGVIKDIKTVGSPKGGGLEEEAVRVVKAMPDWTPGKQDGKTVPVQFNLPIRFVLQK